MSRREILEYPDPRLRLPSAPVTEFDADLERLIDELLETMRSSRAIGLSAPQLGVRQRVLVADPTGSEPRVYVNPEILSTSGALGLVEESCLSVPDVVGRVIRPVEVRARARDGSGRVFELDLEGMDAVCLQHELDHLDGRLFVDRLSLFRRLRIRAAAARRARRAAAAA